MTKDETTYKKSKTCTNDVLKTTLYFDLFKYPLTLDEIKSFSKCSFKEIKAILQELINKKIIFKHGSFYSFNDNLKDVNRREKGNKKAEKILKKAEKISKFISQFPFVEAVFISGSLSKGYFGKEDDIDYFIVTNPNRLWVSRTFLIAYKKIFLLNSKKYFCTNYFMSSNALEIQEKNRFTATEFATLIPMNGNGIYKKLQDENKWVLDYFPNYDKEKKSDAIKKRVLNRFLEYLLHGMLGDNLEKQFMKITKKHQQKEFNKLHKSDFDIAFKGDETISKHHPKNYQIKVINLLNERISTFNIEHSFDIPLEK